MTKSEKHSSILKLIIKNNSRPMKAISTETTPFLKELKGIKAILFDIYGTMLISGSGDIGVSTTTKATFSLKALFSSLSIISTLDKDILNDKVESLLRFYILEDHTKKKKNGMEYPEVNIIEIWSFILNSLAEENSIEGEINQEIIEKIVLNYECHINPVWPIEGINQVLQSLYQRGTKLGIISNAQFYTPLLLKELTDFDIGPNQFDKELLFYSFMEREAKPSINFFSKAVKKLKRLYNIEASEILYIGNDMLNDIYTASQCNCKTVLFAGDKRSLRLRSSVKECMDLEADVTITNWSQFLKILK